MATFTPKTENWKWYADDAAEPTTALANENAVPTLVNDTNIIRLRVTVKETGGKTGTMSPLKVRWSATSGGTYVELSGTQPFNYANGAATDLGTTTTFKTTDGTTHGLYHEAAGNEAISANALNEVDIAIVPVAANLTANTNYFFKLYDNNSAVAADSGKTQPQVLTAPFTPKQQNHRIYKDDAAEPTAALAAENTQVPLQNNINIIRVRTTLAETGGASSGAVTITMEYSTDDSSFTAFGAGNAWNYANGQATNGNSITTNKLTDTTGKMHYHENASGNETFVANTSYELDFAIAPTATVLSNQVYYFRFKQAGTEIVLNSGKTHPNVLTVAFTPKQQNWKVFQDDAAEPVSSLAAENVQPSLVGNASKIRIRANITETLGGAGSGAVTVEYSTDDSSFTAMGSGNAWNYANGQATEGNTITTNKLSDTTNKMKYHESASISETWAVSTGYEMDFCIAPTSTIVQKQIYYFRFKIAGTIVPLNTGKTHPSVKTLTYSGNFFYFMKRF